MLEKKVLNSKLREETNPTCRDRSHCQSYQSPSIKIETTTWADPNLGYHITSWLPFFKGHSGFLDWRFLGSFLGPRCPVLFSLLASLFVHRIWSFLLLFSHINFTISSFLLLLSRVLTPISSTFCFSNSLMSISLFLIFRFFGFLDFLLSMLPPRFKLLVATRPKRTPTESYWEKPFVSSMINYFAFLLFLIFSFYLFFVFSVNHFKEKVDPHV